MQRSKQERERWTEAIVRDELARPAEISEMFLKDWERREEENRTRQLQVRHPTRNNRSRQCRNVQLNSTTTWETSAAERYWEIFSPSFAMPPTVALKDVSALCSTARVYQGVLRSFV